MPLPAPAKLRPAMSSLDSIFKAYDIRGNVPRPARQRPGPLDRRRLRRFRQERPRSWSPGTCARRASSWCAAFADGVTAAGVDVIDLGLCSTDEMYFASGALDAPGAMFTASHNPARYNGIKLCLAGARPVGVESGSGRDQGGGGARIRPRRRSPTAGTVSHATCWRTTPPRSGPSSTVGVLRPSRWWPTRPTGWAAWSCPGSSTTLPFDLEILFGDLDGNFPNHPADPIQPANLRDLQTARPRDRRGCRAGLRRRRRPVLPGRRSGRAGVGLDHHRHRRHGHARQAPGLDDPLQPDLLEGGARGHPGARRASRCRPGSATRSSRR